MNVKIVSVILVLALASMACGFSVDLGQPKAGPDVTESIRVAGSQEGDADVRLEFGAGHLMLSPGAKDLVEGTIVYNFDDLKPEILERGSVVTIRQGNFESLPPFDDLKNEWDFALGDSPMDLTIEAGAYEGTLELGGLALKTLTVNDGASDVNLSFSVPNLVEMSEFRYSTGASDVTLEGLANANFNTLVFNAGAGNYTLDFSGDLQRDATVSIDSGFSDIALVIPEGVNAVVTVDGALADVGFGDGWVKNGNTYTQTGEGPTLTIIVNIGAGNINIRN
jgi:hypothetical protein